MEPVFGDSEEVGEGACWEAWDEDDVGCFLIWVPHFFQIVVVSMVGNGEVVQWLGDNRFGKKAVVVCNIMSTTLSCSTRTPGGIAGFRSVGSSILIFF